VSRERTALWLAYESPAALIEKIQAYLEAGCTTLVLHFSVHAHYAGCIRQAWRESQRADERRIERNPESD